MARIEVTTLIRRPPEDILRYLADFRNHVEFLPAACFRNLSFPDAGQPAREVRLEVQLLGRWWPITLAQSGETAGRELIQASSPPVVLRTTWSTSPMKADRRGPRTAVKLSVDYDLPGGPLGRIMDALLLKREALKIYDRVIRQLPIALEGPPKSGLKVEEA
jgi:hypothetical protein